MSRDVIAAMTAYTLELREAEVKLNQNESPYDWPRALKEQVTFDQSRVTSVDWRSYPILTFPDIPEIVVELINQPNAAPWGAGEPSAAVVPSAISNAVFDATDVRLHSVPFTPDKVKAAMGGA